MSESMGIPILSTIRSWTLLSGIRPAMKETMMNVADILPMFDSTAPEFAGSLAGEAFAATLESHPKYPNLRSGRHGALFEKIDDIVADHIDRIADLLSGLGFDKYGIKIYRAAALKAVRAAYPKTKRARFN